MMLQQAPSRTRPIQVVVIDHSYRHLIGWAQKFANSISGFQVILLTDKSPSMVDGALEIINVRDVAQKLELDELQHKLTFSLYRALIVERAYFDYTNFTECECYSRVNLDEVGELVRCHVNALDEVIRTRADLVLGHFADNAVASLATHIAEHYGVPYAAEYRTYWWPDGYIFLDRPDQTSSQVDDLYRRYYADQSSIDRDAMEKVYGAKRITFQYPDNIVYPLRTRLRKIIGSRHWHDPFSPVNWLIRRLIYPFSQLMTALFTRSLPGAPQGKRYVLFPMHVAPEANLLGSMPELADQFSLIKNISMNLPWGVRLCVKKHPGQRKWTGPRFDFFHKLTALKNVDVIDAGASAERLLRDDNCIAVAVINGTLGLEAALKRKPVFVFGKAVYGVADCFLKPASFVEFRRHIIAISQGRFHFDERAMWSILAALDGAVWHGDREFASAKTMEEATLRSFSAIERYIRSEIWRRPTTDLSETTKDISR
jgi:hypothetical protein